MEQLEHAITYFINHNFSLRDIVKIVKRTYKNIKRRGMISVREWEDTNEHKTNTF